MKRRYKNYTNDEDKIIQRTYDRYSWKEIGHILDRDPDSVRRRAKMLCLDKPQTFYEVFRGDKFIWRGTAEECADAANVKKQHIIRNACPYELFKIKQQKSNSNALFVYKVEVELIG